MSDGLIVTVKANNLALLNEELGFYGRLARKTVEQVVEKKGRDLGIQLYREFTARRYGGNRREKIAEREMRERAAAGNGTRLRPEIRLKFEAAKKQLTQEIRSAGQIRRRAREMGGAGSLDVFRAALKQGISDRKKRTNAWRVAVGMEVGMRQAGRGVLGASFLMFRRQKGDARQGDITTATGTRLIRNRTNQPLGKVEFAPGRVTISGYTEGLDVVDNRYAIINAAAAAVRADMRNYFRRKLGENSQAFRLLKPIN